MKGTKIRRFLIVLLGLILITLGLIVTTSTANASTTGEHQVGFYITDEDRTPLENAVVKVDGNGFHDSHRTNQRGACAFMLDPGNYSVDIDHTEYDSKTMKISITGPTTFTETLSEGSGSGVNWLSSWGILFIIVIFCIVMAILLFGKAMFRTKKRRGGGKIFAIFTIIILLMVVQSQCGCIDSILESAKKVDGSKLYSGKDNWFFTTLEWDIEVETYDSTKGPPKQYPTNKATEQLFSKYKITVQPIDPDDSRDVDYTNDGVPDGYQSDDDFVYGTAIYDSIPQAVNSVGYDGKLYNSIPRDSDHLHLATGIQPQTESRSGIITESERGVFSNLFMTGTDRPFLSLDGNFRDKFYENDIYITIPVTVEVSIKSNILKREIYSCQVDCPIFIHVPFPGHDDKTSEKISLTLYVPLKFIGGGQVTIKPQGSTIKGSAWVNVPIPSEVVGDLIENAMNDGHLSKDLVEIGKLLVLSAGIIGLIIYVVADWLNLWPTEPEPPNLQDYTFIPGSRWHFDKGYLYKALEYLYNVLPSATEPSD